MDAGAGAAVRAEGLVKNYKSRAGDVEAVRGVDLRVERGEVFGFLGPNGAGKSTTVRMLTTLLTITAGTRARGRRRRRARARTRRAHKIGVALQEAGLDPRQTGRELLVLQGRLFGLVARGGGRRAPRSCSSWSSSRTPPTAASRATRGGMKRRLDLASALVHEPEVLFLDEPTTGLDPASRLTVWDEVRRINERGTTVFLTTQYLEEADQLCDRLAIIDDGMIVREGTPAQLKAELRERREPRRPTRRSTTCSSTPPAARATASRATCRRWRHEPGLGARTARAARGVADAGGAPPDAVHPAVLPRRQRRPGGEDLPVGVDGVPARARATARSSCRRRCCWRRRSAPPRCSSSRTSRAATSTSCARRRSRAPRSCSAG